MKKGFEIPIHRSLTEPILLMGVPRAVAILNGTFAAAFILAFHAWWTIPVFAIFHIMAVFMTKRDPLFFEVFKRHLKVKSYYLP